MFPDINITLFGHIFFNMLDVVHFKIYVWLIKIIRYWTSISVSITNCSTYIQMLLRNTKTLMLMNCNIVFRFNAIPSDILGYDSLRRCFYKAFFLQNPTETATSDFRTMHTCVYSSASTQKVSKTQCQLCALVLPLSRPFSRTTKKEVLVMCCWNTLWVFVWFSSLFLPSDR